MVIVGKGKQKHAQSKQWQGIGNKKGITTRTFKASLSLRVSLTKACLFRQSIPFAG